MDKSTLASVMGESLPLDRYRDLAPEFTRALRQANCTTVKRVAMFCAQLGHESGGLRWMEEIASGAAYEGRRDLGNTQPGDGRRFKGRGPIQITGRNNYSTLSRWAHGKGYVPSADYFVKNPDNLSTDRYGFLGAVWYWTVARNLNSHADKGDIRAATRAINGGFNGLDDRIDRWNRARKIGKALLVGVKDEKTKPEPEFDRGDKVILKSPKGAWTRKAPSGEPLKRDGKILIRPKGYQFTVTATKVVQEIIWIKAATYWYSGNVFVEYKPLAKAKIQSPVPGFSVSTPYKKRPIGWPNRHTYWTARGYHTGADYAAPNGATVIAVWEGTVHHYDDEVLGKVVLLYADNGKTYWYCHLLTRVADGRMVKRGNKIGKVGDSGTGASNGPHLHLERRNGHSTNWSGKDLDPLSGW